MPSARHQALARLLSERPEVTIAVLRRWLGLRIPDDVEIHQGPETMRIIGHEDHRADGHIVVHRRDDAEALESFVIEVQLTEDLRKHDSWVTYVLGSRVRLGCTTSLVVFTDSVEVARWAARPIEIDRDRSVLVPYVIGPEQIPMHIDPQEARRVPALAVLAVVGHGRGPEAERIGRLAIETIRPMLEDGDEDAVLYMEVIAAFLDEAVMSMLWEDEMRSRGHEPISDFAKHHHALGLRDGLQRGREEGLHQGRKQGLQQGRKQGLHQGRKQGRVEGRSAALLTVLDARGFEVSAAVRERIEACRDRDVLDAWLRRALVAEHVADVLDG